MKCFCFIVVILMVSSLNASVFSSRPVTDAEISAMKSSNVLSEKPPINPKRLHILTLSYVDFEGKSHRDGQMMVLDVVAPYVLDIFKTLYERKFPITCIKLMNTFQGDDDKAMAVNNTFCFCDRPVAHFSAVSSIHAYGLAFDINPIQNPCVYIDVEKGVATYKPTAGIRYANRMLKRLGKEDRRGAAEEIVGLCKRNGFHYWGGHWDMPIDYQHFQVPRSLANILAVMSFEEGEKFFSSYVKRPEILARVQRVFEKSKLSEVYVKNTEGFNAAWKAALL